MIQRIQTVYLTIAVICLIICCCMPLAQFEPAGMGIPSTLYSLVLMTGEGSIGSYLPAAQFAVTCVAELVCVAAIFGYNNRRLQMKTCVLAMVMLVIWYALLAFFALTLVPDTTFRPEFSACLPAIALVFTFLARKAIKKDDDLVRSADRIR